MNREYTTEEITWATRRLDMAMSRLMVALSRTVGISVPEMLALEYLDTDGSIGPSELARRLQMTSGAMTALMPLVAATSTARPCSTARSRDMASCCSGCPVPAYVALLVWTTSSRPPPVTTSRTTPS